MSSKKAVELHWLQSFQRKFAECLGSGPIVSESPDFFFPDSNLGVEVVEFIRGQGKGGSPYRKCAAVRSKVIQEAQTSFEAQHRHALWVMVFWRSGSCPTRSEQKLLSQEIHRLIASRVSEKSDSWKINSAQLNTPLLETHFAGMNVRRLKTLSNGCWKGAGGGFVGNNINAFQSVLTDKNVKVVKYRKACATV